MPDQAEKQPYATGGCLCGAVKYEVRGPLRDVVVCHCSKCRRFHGDRASYSRVMRDDLVLIEDRGLKWYRSVTDETPDVHRGFCSECGSSLFWDARQSDGISIAAGTLDQPTGLKTIAHIWMEQGGDYYQLSDGLPQYQQRKES